ncbi:MAG: 30S ribosomal protein S17 [Candidatus Cloacimonetes bacterium]|nr:30S ribosomal protein S17 [Candidatus Cloacimonadota bacterium]
MPKQLTGIVLSDKMQKTVVVGVKKLFTHPRYGRKVKRTKKYYAHNELEAKTEDRVLIEETRPLSKTKRWRVVKVLK